MSDQSVHFWEFEKFLQLKNSAAHSEKMDWKEDDSVSCVTHFLLWASLRIFRTNGYIVYIAMHAKQIILQFWHRCYLSHKFATTSKKYHLSAFVSVDQCHSSIKFGCQIEQVENVTKNYPISSYIMFRTHLGWHSKKSYFIDKRGLCGRLAILWQCMLYFYCLRIL